MTLDIEGVVNSGVGGGKPLDRTLRFEPLLFSFSAPNRQMRILGSIVVTETTGLMMAICTTKVVEYRPIRSQATGDE
jgi:hypothetical protein